MSNLQPAGFYLRLSDGRSVQLPIGANLTAANLPGLSSNLPGGLVARVTTHPTDPRNCGFQNLSQTPWRVRLPDGKKAEIAPGKNVRLVAGLWIYFGRVDGEVRLAGTRTLRDIKWWGWALIGGSVLLALILLASWRRSTRTETVKISVPSPTPVVSPSSHIFTAKEIAKNAKPSVVTVLMVQNKTVSQGSGFVVAPKTVVTNLHVIEGGKRGVVKFVGSDTAYDVTRTVSVDEDNDLALLQIDGPEVSALELASNDPEVGDDVYVIGSPKGLEATFSHGNVSAFRSVKGGERLQITAPISHGSSGGPVLNADGKVIAVSVAIIEDGSSQNINFAVPVKYVRKLLNARH
jgi:Trypsin-like peptidase domain